MALTDSYLKWLDRYDVSRPHRSGRWRVRQIDTRTINMLPYVLEVGGYFSEKPTKEDWEYFCKWRDSDEHRHKQNASGFLRFAKYRHLIDGSGESQVKRVREMCANIRKAMTSFADGEIQAGEAAMTTAWGAYMMLLMLSQHKFVMRGIEFQPGRKKGAKGQFTLLVEEAAKVAGNGWKNVISHLESVGGIVQEVDWESEEIWIKGENEPRKFKTVRNKLAKL